MDFYSKLPGFKIVTNYNDFIMFACSNFYFGITTNNQKSINIFSEFNTGLDHLSFEVDNIDNAKQFLVENNIIRDEIKILTNGVRILAFRDPDNIQLEFRVKL